MNSAAEIEDVDAVLLTGLVRKALSSSTAEIRHWEHDPVSYINTEKSILGVHRFSGIAQDRGEVRSWSIVLKAVHAPVNNTDPTHWNYHRREILAYQEGLPVDLPGGLLAPRCFGVAEYTDGVCWLWLEDLFDSAYSTWSLADFGLAAHQLGRFNGAYAAGNPLPVFPWLSQNWLRGWLNFYETICRDVLERIHDEQFWGHPLLRSAFPRPITEHVLRLWSQHEVLLSALDRLPRTFCHMDAYRPNLFIRRGRQGADQLIAIDWVFAGHGAIGEEIANLLAASLIWFEYDAAQAKNLDETVFSRYLRGLRDAGWRGDAQLVRLGYTAACALRWGLVGLWWLISLHDSAKEADLEKKWGRPLPELISQWSKTIYYNLGLAEEAYGLQHALFG